MVSNLEEIERLEVEIQKYSPEVPILDNYTEDDFMMYLSGEGIYPEDEDYDTYKTHLVTQYEKRQDYINSRDYLVTLNKILENLIEFYQDYRRDPDSDELVELASGTGTQDYIDDSIEYIEDNIL
jgi:hypothetical protein